MRGYSKKRLELGEEKWAEYQRQRVNKKSDNWAKKNIEKVTRSRRRKKELLVQYKGGECEKCGLKTDIVDVYDFHHIDPSQKEFGLANKGKNLSLDECKKEVDKCLLVCKNCHAIIHYELHIKNRNAKIANSKIEIKHREFLEDKTCLKCGNWYKPKRSKQKFCCKTCADRKNSR